LGKESSKFKKPIFDKEYKKIIHHGKDREYKRRLREITVGGCWNYKNKKGSTKGQEYHIDMENRDIWTILELRI